MKKSILITLSFCFLISFPFQNPDLRRIKMENTNPTSSFQPLINLLYEYWGDNFKENLNFLLDVYTVWVAKNEGLVKTRLTELRQFHPILYPWIVGMGIGIKRTEEYQKEKLIKDQLWLAVAPPARKNLEKLLHKENRTKNEQEFLNWLNQNNYTLKEAVYRFISGIYNAIAKNPDVEVLDFQIEISPPRSNP